MYCCILQYGVSLLCCGSDRWLQLAAPAQLNCRALYALHYKLHQLCVDPHAMWYLELKRRHQMRLLVLIVFLNLHRILLLFPFPWTRRRWPVALHCASIVLTRCTFLQGISLAESLTCRALSRSRCVLEHSCLHIHSAIAQRQEMVCWAPRCQNNSGQRQSTGGARCTNDRRKFGHCTQLSTLSVAGPPGKWRIGESASASTVSPPPPRRVLVCRRNTKSA